MVWSRGVGGFAKGYAIASKFPLKKGCFPLVTDLKKELLLDLYLLLILGW